MLTVTMPVLDQISSSSETGTLASSACGRPAAQRGRKKMKKWQNKKMFSRFPVDLRKNPKFAALWEKVVKTGFWLKKVTFWRKMFRAFFSEAWPERGCRMAAKCVCCLISLEMWWNKFQATFEKNIFWNIFSSVRFHERKGVSTTKKASYHMGKCSKVIFTPC